MVALLVILTVATVISCRLIAESRCGRDVADLSPAASSDPISSHFFVHGGHTWARLDTSGEAKVGIDHFLLGILGGVDKVSLPEPGRHVRQGEKIFSVSREGRELYLVAPIEGVISSINRQEELSGAGRGDAAYARGWLFTIRPRNLSGSIKNVMNLDAASSWFDAESRRFSAFLVSASPQLEEVGDTLPDGGSFTPGVIERLDEEMVRAFEKEFLS